MFGRLIRWLASYKHFHVYTDGSFKKGVGSWAFVIVKRDRVIREQCGRSLQTESNLMEIQAAIEALSSLPVNSKVTLYSDSRVLVDAVKRDIHKWSLQGWVKRNGREIPYADSFQKLEKLMAIHGVEWRWVKAHSGNHYNERCDELCLQARSG